MNDENFYLKPWHKSVSRDNCFLKINECYEFRFITPPEKFFKFSGWYAVYPEGIFTLFKRNNGFIYIGWRERFVKLESVSRITWESKFSGREFICYDFKNNFLLDVRYVTFLRLAFNPLKLVESFLLPDDDWGLVCDLPSFIHSNFDKIKLNEIINQLGGFGAE